jgi:hypothetical protein
MVIQLRRLSGYLLTILFMLSLTVTFLMLTVNTAFADDEAVTNVQPVAPVTVSQLTPQLVAGLIGALIPLLVSLLARTNASPQVKVWINLVLTAALGAVSALVVPIQGGEAEFGWVPFLTAWLYAFITSTISYLGALKNFNLNNVLLEIGGIFGQKTPPPSGGGDIPPADQPGVVNPDDPITT